MHLFFSFLLLLFLDQFSKVMVFTSYSFFNEVIIIDPLLSFQLAINYGAAWGFFENQRWLLMSAHVLALGFIVYFWPVLRRGRWTSLSLPFLLAGVFGNGIDRFRLGFVIDFIKIDSFPIFNFADIYLTLTAFFFLMAMWKGDEFFR